MHQSLIRKIFIWSFLGFALLFYSCGDENTPRAETLTLREWLGMKSKHLDEFDTDEKAQFAALLIETWSQEAREDTREDVIDIPLVNETHLREPLDIVKAKDQERALKDEDVLVSAQLIEKNEGLGIQLNADPEELGLKIEASKIKLLKWKGERYSGSLIYDERWSKVEKSALYGFSEREAVENLEALWRRILGHWKIRDSKVQIVPAPQAPLGIWYATHRRALFVNPNILYLFKYDIEKNTSLRVIQQGLTLDFIESCVREERERCNRCLNEEDESSMQLLCQPNFKDSSWNSEQSIEAAKSECNAMAEEENQGFYLYCYQKSMLQYWDCFEISDIYNRCGSRELPIQSLEDLHKLDPMLEDQVCQDSLLRCYQQESDTSGSMSPLPPEEENESLPPVKTHATDDSTNPFLDICTEVFCQVGMEIACDVAEEGCDSSCEGDGL